MPIEVIDAPGKMLLKIRGMLKKADYDRMVQIAKEAIVREGKSGRWPFLTDSKDGSGPDSGDVSFMMEQGQQIEKIAIVGDENGATTHLLLPLGISSHRYRVLLAVTPERSAHLTEPDRILQLQVSGEKLINRLNK